MPSLEEAVQQDFNMLHVSLTNLDVHGKRWNVGWEKTVYTD